MARNRMIKPEFWASETLMRVSRDARLTFIGMWNFCDDYGFCLSSTRSIIGDIYPYDESVTEQKLKSWLAELVEVKLLIPVDYKTKKLFFVKGWGEHQTVQHKSKRSFIHVDDLELVIKDSLKSHEELINVYLESHAPKIKKKEESNKKESGVFTPPQLHEISQYCLERKNSVDATKFLNFYESKGWMVGKNKMKDWKACVRTWENNTPKKETEKSIWGI